jgi:large subunit ribosomal protein L14
MITIKSYVYISDSSGARIGECIKILRSKYYHAKLADQIIVAVKVALTERKAKRHDVLKGTIIRLKKITSRSNGMKINFGDNAVVVYNKRNELMGSRLFGPVAQELRIATGKKKHTKLLSIAAAVV